jgi:hypothetical protein
LAIYYRDLVNGIPALNVLVAVAALTTATLRRSARSSERNVPGRAKQFLGKWKPVAARAHWTYR